MPSPRPEDPRPAQGPPAARSLRRRLLRWYFRTRDGELVLGQAPNLSIKLTGTLYAASFVVRLGGLRRRSRLGAVLDRAGTGAFLWWSADELLRGVTPYRRTLGAAGLLVIGLRLRWAARRRRR